MGKNAIPSYSLGWVLKKTNKTRETGWKHLGKTNQVPLLVQNLDWADCPQNRTTEQTHAASGKHLALVTKQLPGTLAREESHLLQKWEPTRMELYECKQNGGRHVTA